MFYIVLQKAYGVWQVDSRMPCPFSTGIGLGMQFVKNDI